MDRTVGFSSYAPLFVQTQDANGQPVMRTAENKLHWFNDQSFPKRKSANTKRIFCMGGSTTYGHPYWDETSFAGWMREYLPAVDAKHQWEVINAGGISYGSFRVAALMEELAQYEPDMFVIYCAHNEFLERQTYARLFEQPSVVTNMTSLLSRSRIWTVAERIVSTTRRNRPAPADASTPLMPTEVDEELNHTVGPVDYHRDDQWRENVVAQYRTNLQRMIDIAEQAGAKIVLVMPAANEKDCSPFKSQWSVTEPAVVEQLEASMKSGAQALGRQDFENAVEEYSRVVELDSRSAEAHYRLGRALLGQGKAERAFEEFRRAIDEDVCPLRSITEIETTLREVAESNSLTLIDFPMLLRHRAQDEAKTTILGDEQFLDHVHPTIEGNSSIAFWIVDELVQSGWVNGQRLSSQQFAAIRKRVLDAIDKDDEIFALRNLAKVYHWAGKFEEAIPKALDTLELAPGDAESRYIIASCQANLGYTDQALAEYERLFADGVGYPRAYLPYGELLASQGQYESAKAYLLLAVLRTPDNAAPYVSLAKVHQALGEDQFAEEALVKAKSLGKQ